VVPCIVAKSQKTHLIQSVMRPGEGVVMGHVAHVEPGSNVVSLDLSGAPVPDRRFGADAARVAVGTDVVRILFGQFRGAGPHFEHVVVVKVPYTAASNFLRSLQGEVSEVANGFLTRYKVAPAPRFDDKELPSQTFTLDANILIVGVTGREACIDLYHVSPHVFKVLQRGGREFRGEPVARVILTTRLVMDIADFLRVNLPKRPEEEDEHA
jgi:hypothetical protein